MKKTLSALLLVSTVLLIFTTVTAAGPVLDRINSKNTLVVGITGTQPPLNATSKTGDIIGMDADIAKLIANTMGVELEFSTMPFSELLPALMAGKIDLVISSMTITAQRNMKVAFIGPYYISGKGILTKTKHVEALQGMGGINQAQFKVAALENSTSQKFVEKEAPKAELVPVKSYNHAIEMLFEDKIDILIADAPFCALSAFRYPDKGLTAGQDRLTFEPLGIATVEDTLLINWLQNFMVGLNGSGELKRLHETWLNKGDWISQLPE